MPETRIKFDVAFQRILTKESGSISVDDRRVVEKMRIEAEKIRDTLEDGGPSDKAIRDWIAEAMEKRSSVIGRPKRS